MRPFLTATALTAAALAGAAGAAEAQTGCAPFPSKLQTKQPSARGGDVSHAFVDANGCKIRLHGFSLFPVWSRSHYEGIKAKGFNGVRFVMPWRTYEPSKGSFTGLGTLDQQIAHARSVGLYVVLANHLDEWNPPPAWTTGSDDIAKVLAHGRGWIQTLAARYKDNPVVAGIDLYNEPKSNDPYRVFGLYRTMTDWVREVAPDEIAMVEPGYGNTDMTGLAGSLQVHKRNVVYSFHDYYAGDGSAGTTHAGFTPYRMAAGRWTWNGTTGYRTIADHSDLAAHLKVHLDWAQRADVPVWVGEWGVNPSAPNATALVDQKVALYRKYGLGRAWWLYTCQDNALAIKTAGCAWKPIVERFRLP
jgi:Cellulase (glycosyl hydrolase family 5)